jgi:hypothetical protein
MCAAPAAAHWLATSTPAAKASLAAATMFATAPWEGRTDAMAAAAAGTGAAAAAAGACVLSGGLQA